MEHTYVWRKIFKPDVNYQKPKHVNVTAFLGPLYLKFLLSFPVSLLLLLTCHLTKNLLTKVTTGSDFFLLTSAGQEECPINARPRSTITSFFFFFPLIDVH